MNDAVVTMPISGWFVIRRLILALCTKLEDSIVPPIPKI